MKHFIDRFFVLPSAKTLGRFRIALGVLTLLHLVILGPHLHDYFSNEGYISTKLSLRTATLYQWSILHHITSYPSLIVFYIFSLATTVCLTLGIFPQFMSLLCYGILISFLNRFPQISYGGFIFTSYALLFSSLIPLNQSYCPTIFQKFSLNLPKIPQVLSAWAVRMIQLEVCTIYFFAGLAKLQNPHWLDGSQLLYTLNIFGAYWNFTWLQENPLISAALTSSSLILELFFPIVIWIPKIRYFWIAGLVLMHMGIALTMNVTFLSETMIGLLTIFF